MLILKKMIHKILQNWKLNSNKAVSEVYFFVKLSGDLRHQPFFGPRGPKFWIIFDFYRHSLTCNNTFCQKRVR